MPALIATTVLVLAWLASGSLAVAGFTAFVAWALASSFASLRALTGSPLLALLLVVLGLGWLLGDDEEE